MPLVRSSRREDIVAAALLLALAACGRGDIPMPTDATAVPVMPVGQSRAGYLLDVDTRRRSVRVAAPAAAGAAGLSYSILEGSAIGLQVGNYSVSEVGAYTPGKVRVQLDVSVANQLPGVALVPSAMANAGAATPSLMLFPLLQSAELTTGSVAVSEDGTVLVNRSSRTVVQPSVDWNGDGGVRSRGFDFGADTACVAPAPGCTRWEALPPLPSGATSPMQTVGFDLDPTVSGFRAWLLLLADLQTGGTPPPPPPPPPPPTVGVPFGPHHLIDDDGEAFALPDGTQPFSFSHDGYSASNLIYRVVAARATGRKLLLALTGGAHEDYMTDGVFDRDKWEAKLRTYDRTEIRQVIAQGVADGIIVGANVMDEPYVSGGVDGGGNTWGPKGTLTKARVDSLCADVKAMFPTLAVGVEHQHQLFEPDKSYRSCDFIIDQYGDRFGDVADFRDAALAMARRDGHDVLFSMNILDGGPMAPDDGRWLCPSTSAGRGTFDPRCEMLPEQMRRVALTLGPAGCGGLIMWRYDPDFMGRPENQLAFHDMAAALSTMPSRPCVRR